MEDTKTSNPEAKMETAIQQYIETIKADYAPHHLGNGKGVPGGKLVKNQSQHTPGPWHVDVNDSQDIRDEEGYHLASTFNLKGDGIANARLIAAAPELLEMLRGAEAFMTANKDRLNAIEMVFVGKIRQAIAKAEGK